MAHDPKLVEALRWHLACYFSQNRMPHMSGDPQARLLPHQKRDLHDAVDAALTALCTLRPDIAKILDGTAVAVDKHDAQVVKNYWSMGQTMAECGCSTPGLCVDRCRRVAV